MTGGPIRILTEAELRRLVDLDIGMIDLIADAFVELSAGRVVMPPILSMEIAEHHGEVDVKTAYIPGLDGFAIKVSPGFFDNPKLGLPSTSGLMIVLSARTGQVEALLLDNGYLTDIRTAAAGAVAARALAPSRVAVAGVVGTGMQARLQIRAASLVRDIGEVLVHGRDAERAQACANDIQAATGLAARVEPDLERLVALSQLVVTTTPARAPLVRAEWLHPGLHVTAMGSDQPGKNEIDPRALAAADLYAVDRLSQCAVQGELAAARAQGLMRDDPPELGAILAGDAAGRVSDGQVTICDLTGTGAQDTAIATFALARAVASKAGTAIER